MKFLTLATGTLFLMSQVQKYFITRLMHIVFQAAVVIQVALMQPQTEKEILMIDVMLDQVIGIVNIH